MNKLLSILATSIALIALLAAPLRAQELSLPSPEEAKLTFDVVSIHPSKPPGPQDRCFINPLQGGVGYQVRCLRLRNMISLLYKIPARQITGGPEWMDSESWDIDAKADKSYTLDELHAMFQNLFAERFGLKYHLEKKPGNIYALTIESGSLKMTPNTDPWDPHPPIDGGAIQGFTGKRVPINYLCWWLGAFLQQDERPVINTTGLTGNYDFKLAFLPELPPDFDKSSLPPDVLDRPNLFTALREQLGLKLIAQKGSVSYMVIDHVQKASEN